MPGFKCFLLGHKKEYVAVRFGRITHGPYSTYPYTRGTLARWICKRCIAVGEDDIESFVKVHQGKLVPDEKAWANWERGY